jgi:hypothetical protein
MLGQWWYPRTAPKTYLTTTFCISILAATPVAVQAQPIMIASPDSTRIVMASGASIPDVGMRDLPQTTLSITNRSRKNIICIVMRWTSRQANGSDETRWAYFDGYFLAPSRPVLAPGESLVVSEFGAQKLSVFSAAKSASRADSPIVAHFGESPLGGTITASADLIVFDDGEILGDDTSKYEQKIIARHKAMLFVGSRLQGRSNASEIRDEAEIIRSQARDSSVVSLTGTVLRSPNPEGTARYFANHSIPAKFYRRP